MFSECFSGVDVLEFFIVFCIFPSIMLTFIRHSGLTLLRCNEHTRAGFKKLTRARTDQASPQRLSPREILCAYTLGSSITTAAMFSYATVANPLPKDTEARGLELRERMQKSVFLGIFWPATAGVCILYCAGRVSVGIVETFYELIVKHS